MRETAAVLKLLRRGVIAGLVAGGAVRRWQLLASRAAGHRGRDVPDRALPLAAPPGPSDHRPGTEPDRPHTGGAPPERPAARRPDDERGDPTGPASTGQDRDGSEPIDGSCPATHPVKAKLTSGIYHEPGGGNYDRIRAERCYVDADAAIADGLRAPSAG